MPTSLPVRTTVDRRHTLRGKRSIDWFFSHRRWLKLRSKTIQVAYAMRPRPANEAALLFLLVVSKRDVKRAHDRNRLKRWLRAAITATSEISELESKLTDQQLIVMQRIAHAPDTLSFEIILQSVHEIAAHLMRVTTERHGIPVGVEE